MYVVVCERVLTGTVYINQSITITQFPKIGILSYANTQCPVNHSLKTAPMHTHTTHKLRRGWLSAKRGAVDRAGHQGIPPTIQCLRTIAITLLSSIILITNTRSVCKATRSQYIN